MCPLAGSMTKKRILLAEDSRFLSKAAETALSRAEFTVLLAADGEEALRIATTEVPDLILLDLIMPKLQGFEVLRQLKSNPATVGIPVIVMSNLGQDQDVELATKLGAEDYLIKAALPLKEMVRRVERYLGAGSTA